MYQWSVYTTQTSLLFLFWDLMRKRPKEGEVARTT